VRAVPKEGQCDGGALDGDGSVVLLRIIEERRGHLNLMRGSRERGLCYECCSVTQIL
jgi:hypothetical protein